MNRDKLADLRPLRRTMPVEVFIGGTGDLVLLQEQPDPAGEAYFRMIVHPDDADALIDEIRSAVDRHRGLAAMRQRKSQGGL